jgi:hypothetical protein
MGVSSGGSKLGLGGSIAIFSEGSSPMDSPFLFFLEWNGIDSMASIDLSRMGHHMNQRVFTEGMAIELHLSDRY